MCALTAPEAAIPAATKRNAVGQALTAAERC
jgi:hypothetical protein